jgi:hypothetical protein
MSIQTSYQADIRPLFTERDIDAMTKAFNIANYDDVKAHAAASTTEFVASAAPSCRPRRREGAVPGRNPGSNYSPNGWRTDASPEKRGERVDWVKYGVGFARVGRRGKSAPGSGQFEFSAAFASRSSRSFKSSLLCGHGPC